MNLPAQSLIYTLLISLIVSTLLGGYILVNHYQLIFLHRLDAAERARENLRSGLLWYLHLGWNLGETFETDLFDFGSDHVSISSEPWGLLGLFHVQGRYNQTVAEQSCLVGQGRNLSTDFSLSLTDQRQPLVIVGNTRLEGKLLLPQSGIRSGQIGATAWIGSTLPTGANAPISIPSLNSRYFPSLENFLRNVAEMQPSGEWYSLENDSVSHPWTEKVYERVSPHSLLISASSYRGKCLILSGGEVRIAASTEMEHTLIFARRITFASGFRGSVQAVDHRGNYAQEKRLILKR
ncbi:MAG: hypothetical protein R3D00_16320 [Bacteroidia bacterium]